MSLSLRIVPFVLACLACDGHARQLQTATKQPLCRFPRWAEKLGHLKQSQSNCPLTTFGLLLRALHPSACFRAPLAIHGPGLPLVAHNSGVSSHGDVSRSHPNVLMRPGQEPVTTQQSDQVVGWREKPAVQVSLMLASYMFQVVWLAKQQLLTGISRRSWAKEITGELVVACIIVARAVAVRLGKQRQPQDNQQQAGEDTAPPSLTPAPEVCAERRMLVDTAIGLIVVHLLSSYTHTVIDILLNCLLILGVPISFNQKYALQILLSYLAYVLMAVHLLGTRLKPFFPPPFGKGSWLKVRWRTKWLGWVVGGYYASVLGYKVADVLKHAILGPDSDPDMIVAKLIKPGDGDLGALAIGSIAPCAIAPVLEEVVYRGFLLRALLCFTKLKFAMPIHALLFGLHHVVGGRAAHVVFPLSVLAAMWGWFYVATGNLVVPILIHAMFNSRGFLESLLEGEY